MSAAPEPDEPLAPLRQLRLVWWAFVGFVALIGIGVPLVAPDPGSTVPAWLPATLVAVLGAGAAVAVLVLDRTFTATPPASDADAAGQFRTRVFLAAALTEFPALLAVAVAFVVGPPWVATVGAGVALLGLLLVRPTLSAIDRYDAAWRARGTDVSVRRGLLGTTPGAHL